MQTNHFFPSSQEQHERYERMRAISHQCQRNESTKRRKRTAEHSEQERERDLLSFFRILFFTFFLFRTHHMKINKNEKKKKRASVDSSTKYTHDKLQQAGRQD